MLINLLNPKLDYVFKRIFGYSGNEKITKNLLSCTLQQDISNITLDNNPILEKDLFNDKFGILDIKATLDNFINVDIEIQVVDQKNIEKRILFYLSKMYTQTIHSGQDYNSLEKCIVILFSNFELDSLRNIPNYITKWNFREERFSKNILTDDMEIVIIELPKFNKYKLRSKDDKLNQSKELEVGNMSNNKDTKLDKQANYEKNLKSWLEFLTNPEEVDTSNLEIIRAQQILAELSMDEHERYLAELREKYILDQKAVEDLRI